MSGTAIALVLLSAAIHAGWNFLTKTSRDPLAFSAVKSGLYLVYCAALLPFFALDDLTPRLWVFLLATGVAHAIYVWSLGMAYRHGDISLVYPIARSAPAVIPVFAVWLLGEQLSPGGIVGIAVAVAAVWIVNTGGRFRWAAFTAPGSGFAYITLTMVVSYSLIDKQAMQILHVTPWSGPAPRALVFMVVGETMAAAMYLVAIVPRLPPGGLRASWRDEKRRAALSTAGEISSYVLVLYVFQTEQVSYVVAVRQISVVFAVLLGTIALREPFGRSRLLGASGLVLAVYLIGRYA